MDRTRSALQGTVRALLSSNIAKIIARYRQDNPEVQVRVDATNCRVDARADKCHTSP
jgi:hypothetical protein